MPLSYSRQLGRILTCIPARRTVATRLFAIAAVLLPVESIGEPFAYVANLGGNTVSVIDVESDTVVATIPTGEDPDGIAVAADGSRAYVANFLSDSLTAIDTASQSVLDTIEVGAGPVGLAVSPDGGRVFVANRGAASVSVVDTATLEVIDTIAVEAGPNAVAVGANGANAVVTNSHTKFPGLVSVVDIEGLSAGTVEVQRNPNRVAISPDGRTAFVANFRSWNVSVIDLDLLQATSTIRVSGRPSGIAVNPNGTFLYVTTEDGFLQVIDLYWLRVHRKVAVGRRPSGIGILRDGSIGYVANFGDDTVTAVDLVHHEPLSTIEVGERPFAVGVNCVEDGCDVTPLTALPTNSPTQTLTPSTTRTPSRTPTRSLTHTATRTPTRTPTAELTGEDPVVRSVSTTVRPGDIALVQVVVETNGTAIDRLTHDIRLGSPLLFPPGASRNRVDCVRNPAIKKNTTRVEGLWPCRQYCGNAIATVSSNENNDAIADGSVLYSCRIPVHPQTPAGSYLFELRDTRAQSPDGSFVEVIERSGTITVAGEPRPTSTVRPTASPEVPVATPTPTLRGDEIVVTGSTVEIDSRNYGRLDVSLVDSSDYDVSGIEVEVDLGDVAWFGVSDERIACWIDPQIGKNAGGFGAQPFGCEQYPEAQCRRVKAFVLDLFNLEPIAEGSTLFSCRVHVDDATPPGTYFLPLINVAGSTPSGEPLPGVGQAGRLVVSDRPGPDAQEILVSQPRMGPGNTGTFNVLLAEPPLRFDRLTMTIDFPEDYSIRGWPSYQARCVPAPELTERFRATLAPAGCIGDRIGSCRSATIELDLIDDAADRLETQHPEQLHLFSCAIGASEDAQPKSDNLDIRSIELRDASGGLVDSRLDARGIEIRPAAEAWIRAASISLAPEETGELRIDLHNQNGAPIAGTENEIYLPSGIDLVTDEDGNPDCAADPAHGKQAYFKLLPDGCEGSQCRTLKSLVLSLSDLAPLPNDTPLYSCRVRAGRRSGLYPLEILSSQGSTANGDVIAIDAQNGEISIVAGSPTLTRITISPEETHTVRGESFHLSFGVSSWSADIARFEASWVFPRGIGVESPEACGVSGIATREELDIALSDGECTDGTSGCQHLKLSADLGKSRPLPIATLARCHLESADSTQAGVNQILASDAYATGFRGESIDFTTSGAIIQVAPEPELFIRASEAVGRLGDEVQIDIILDSNSDVVTGTENVVDLDRGLEFPPDMIGLPTCWRNPAINKAVTIFSFSQTTPRRSVKALVIDFGNLDLIPSGSILYSCKVSITGGQPGERLEVRILRPGGADGDGDALPVYARSGGVTIAAGEGGARVSGSRSASRSFCVAGVDDGTACDSDAHCRFGACMRAPAICDGGADDGLLCDCPGGQCTRDASCSESLDGRCRGGSADGECCEIANTCSDGRACVATRTICADGASKGLPCIDSRHCQGLQCILSSSRCSGGDFDGFACIDGSDCPLGACSVAVPNTPTPTRTRPSTVTPTSRPFQQSTPTVGAAPSSTHTPQSSIPTPSVGRDAATPTSTASADATATSVETASDTPTATPDITRPATPGPTSTQPARPTATAVRATRTQTATQTATKDPGARSGDDDSCAVVRPTSGGPRAAAWLAALVILWTRRRSRSPRRRRS